MTGAADRADRVGKLSDAQRRLLERLTKGGAAPAAAVDRIEPGAGGQEPPLSLQQERIWAAELQAPGTSLNNLTMPGELVGSVDVDAMERAFAEVVSRHDVLRAGFHRAERGVRQVIAPRLAPPFERCDLRGLPPDRAERECRRLMEEEARRPFDVAGPLVRARVIVLDGGRHVLLISSHHLVNDNVSTGIVLAELARCYVGQRDGTPSGLPPVRLQYGDFAVWQRSPERRRALEPGLAFWREELAGARPVELVTDRPHPPVSSFRGEQLEVVFPERLTADLRALAAGSGVSLFAVLTAGLAALLHRLSGQRDLVLGVPVAGRTRSDLLTMVGCFVNTIPVRLRLAGDPTFAALAAQAARASAAGLAHQDVPLSEIVEAVRPERAPGRHQLVQVVLNFRDDLESRTMRAAGEIPGEARSTMRGLERLPTGSAQGLDLIFDLVDAASGGLHGLLIYNTDVFQEATAARLAVRLQTLLESAVEHPGRPVSELRLTTPEEDVAAQLAAAGPIREWGSDDLPALVRAQAARRPRAVACQQGDRTLTYAELVGLAGRLGAELRALGEGPERVVAVAAPRSPEALVAVLGVLEAGAAYVPLDPGLPATRLADLVRRCGCRVVLTASGVALPGLPAEVRLVPVELTPGAAAPAAPAAVPLDHPAYVIFTSGSTGEPKGVVTTRRGIRNRVLWTVHEHGIGPDDVVLQKTALSFDASVWELLAPLVAGARIVMVGAGGHRAPAEIAAVGTAAGATVLQAVPTMLRALLAEPGARFDRLRHLFSAGEELSAELASRCRERWPGAALHNTYGPTEASIDMTCWDHRPDGRRPPIGRPLVNQRVLVLDRELRPVPDGVPGELFLGGDQLARGYLGRPGQTAERFVPDPTGPPGARLYRTGDRGRRLPDGDLEYRGRLDAQVKLRGYRIEPGEVEAALRALPGVADAAVSVQPDERGEPTLVAHVQAARAVPAAELRAALAGSLPDHLVPARYRFVAELPRTASGKLDRGRLAETPALVEEGEAPAAAPPDELEELLAALAADVLRVERVRPEDDFFARGGQSLSAMQLVARIREALGVGLLLNDLFEAPVLRDLARAVRARREGAQAPPLRRRAAAEPVPLSLHQRSVWVKDRLHHGGHVSHLPVLVRVGGALDAHRLRDALGAVAGAHEALRSRLTPGGDEPLVEVDDRVEVDVDVFAGDGSDEAALRSWAWEVARRPFDLGRAPLLRGGLAPIGGGGSLVLLVFHHLVIDAWSIDVVVRELAVACAGVAPGRRPPDAPDYPDFAVWQRRLAAAGRAEAEVERWRALLDGATWDLALPYDRRRPDRLSGRGRDVPLDLGADHVAALRALGRREGATFAMTMLAAWGALLHAYSGQDDVLVASPIAGRQEPGLQRMVGLFADMALTRLDLGGDPTFQELVGRARRAGLASYGSGLVPLDELLRAVAPGRDLSRAVAGAILNVQPASPPVAAGGATWTPLPLLETDVVKADLNLSVIDGGDGVRASLDYAVDLFEPATAERMARHLEALVAAAAGSPEARLSDLRALDLDAAR